MHLNLASELFGRGGRAKGLSFLDKAAGMSWRDDRSLPSHLMDLGLPSEEARSKGAISAIVAPGNLTKTGRAGQVRAVCSADGSRWYSLGTAEARFDRSVHIGPFAIGLIPRFLYHGAFPEGSAIRFESLLSWQSGLASAAVNTRPSGRVTPYRTASTRPPSLVTQRVVVRSAVTSGTSWTSANAMNTAS